MEREDAKDLTLSVLVIAVILLVADCAWLHVRSARQSETIEAQAAVIVALNEKLEHHLNPPKEATLTDKAKDTYQRAKEAVAKQYEKVKAAAAAGFRAAQAEFDK